MKPWQKQMTRGAMHLSCNPNHLLLLLLISTVIILLLGSLSLLPLDTTRASTSKWRSESKVNVLLGVETNDEGWDIDNLLANTMKVSTKWRRQWWT